MYLFSDLTPISRIILSGAYFMYYLREESQICYMDTSLDADVSHTILRSLWSWLMTPVSRIIMSGAYLLYYFDVGIPNFVCWFLLGWRSGVYHFGSLWHSLLASFLVFFFFFFVSGAYLLYYSYLSSNGSYPRPIPLDHSSCYCDISCYFSLSYDVTSGSEITPGNKIDKPLVVYRFMGNLMTSITMLLT